MKECIQCDNLLKHLKDKYTVKKDNKTIIINNVPSTYCNNCNETYYIAAVADNLEKIIEIMKNVCTDTNIIEVDYETIINTSEYYGILKS